MIGNNVYIADILSKKEDSPSNDAHEIEMIMNEYWRYIKYLQKFTNETSLSLPHLGRFDYKMGKGNQAIRHFTKTLDKIRTSKTYQEDNEKTLIFTKLFQDQLDACLKQKEILIEVFRLRDERWQQRKKTILEANNSNVDNISSQTIDAE